MIKIKLRDDISELTQKAEKFSRFDDFRSHRLRDILCFFRYSYVTRRTSTLKIYFYFILDTFSEIPTTRVFMTYQA